MWIVYTHDEGLDGIYDSYEEALRSYESHKEAIKDYVQSDGEFSTDELVVLAKVEKHLYSADTFNPVTKEDADGNEVATGDTYWEFKEDDYTQR